VRRILAASELRGLRARTMWPEGALCVRAVFRAELKVRSVQSGSVRRKRAKSSLRPAQSEMCSQALHFACNRKHLPYSSLTTGNLSKGNECPQPR
jgi:hypothetical protein